MAHLAHCGRSPVAGRQSRPGAPHCTPCTPWGASCGSPGRTRNGTPCTLWPVARRRWPVAAWRVELHTLHTVGRIPRRSGPRPKWHSLHTVWGAGPARRIAHLAHRRAHPAEVGAAPGIAHLAHRMGGGPGASNCTPCTPSGASRGSPGRTRNGTACTPYGGGSGAPTCTPCTPWGASCGSPGRARNGTTCTPYGGVLGAPTCTPCTPWGASRGSPGRARNGTGCTPYEGQARRADLHTLHTVVRILRPGRGRGRPRRSAPPVTPSAPERRTGASHRSTSLL